MTIYLNSPKLVNYSRDCVSETYFHEFWFLMDVIINYSQNAPNSTSSWLSLSCYFEYPIYPEYPQYPSNKDESPDYPGYPEYPSYPPYSDNCNNTVMLPYPMYAAYAEYPSYPED